MRAVGEAGAMPIYLQSLVAPWPPSPPAAAWLAAAWRP